VISRVVEAILRGKRIGDYRTNTPIKIISVEITRTDGGARTLLERREHNGEEALGLARMGARSAFGSHRIDQRHCGVMFNLLCITYFNVSMPHEGVPSFCYLAQPRAE